jgi:hypothetical protein
VEDEALADVEVDTTEAEEVAEDETRDVEQQGRTERVSKVPQTTCKETFLSATRNKVTGVNTQKRLRHSRAT